MSCASAIAPRLWLLAVARAYYSDSPDETAITAWLVDQLLIKWVLNWITTAQVGSLDFSQPAKSLSVQVTSALGLPWYAKWSTAVGTLLRYQSNLFIRVQLSCVEVLISFPSSFSANWMSLLI